MEALHSCPCSHRHQTAFPLLGVTSHGVRSLFFQDAIGRQQQDSRSAGNILCLDGVLSNTDIHPRGSACQQDSAMCVHVYSATTPFSPNAQSPGLASKDHSSNCPTVQPDRGGHRQPQVLIADQVLTARNTVAFTQAVFHTGLPHKLSMSPPIFFARTVEHLIRR